MHGPLREANRYLVCNDLCKNVIHRFAGVVVAPA